MARQNPPSATNAERARDISAGGIKSVPIVPQNARHRRDRIKLLLTSMTEQTNKVVAILEEAQTNEDHLTLGYKSWTAYIAGEYAGLLADLNRAQRREVVGSLTAAGMSTRAIAGVVGTSQKTVVKDLQSQVIGGPTQRCQGGTLGCLQGDPVRGVDGLTDQRVDDRG